MANLLWDVLPGETPIDLSHLTDNARAIGIKNRSGLSKLEAVNITKAFIKYLAAKPSISLAPFDYNWVLSVHQQMYCDVWQWASPTYRPLRELQQPNSSDA